MIPSASSVLRMMQEIDTDIYLFPRTHQKGEKVENLTVKYFREIASYPLLNAEEEKRITKQIIELEKKQWINILSNPFYAVEFAPILINSFPKLRCKMNFIYGAAKRLKKRKAKLDRKFSQWYYQRIRELVDEIMDYDIDRIYLEAFVEFLLCFKKERISNFDVKENKLIKEIRKTKEEIKKIKNYFISSNLRLVISIAKKYYKGTLPLMDLIQEGNLGLLKAVERYKPSMGYRFSTYASWWIKHAINRAVLEKSRTVRMPVHMVDATQKIKKVKQMLLAKEGREPSEEELAETIGMKMKKLRKVEKYDTGQILSLDRKIDEDGKQSFITLIHDNEMYNPATKLAFKDWCYEISRLLQILSPLEADIVRYRYGMDSDEGLTLKEIGEKYNLSRERIRQIQKNAIQKMRSCVRGEF